MKFTEEQEAIFLTALHDRKCITLLEHILNGTACIIFDCPHHVYYKVSQRKQKNMRRADASKIYGCMLAVIKEFTLEETGEIFGLSRERARQIEEKALNKLKKRVNKIEMDSTLD